VSYTNVVRLYQARELRPHLQADGHTRVEYQVLQAIADRTAYEDAPPAYPGGPPRMINTCFPGEATIAADCLYKVRRVSDAIDKLTSENTKNPTGKPYLTKVEIPGNRIWRYVINVALFDLMGSPFVADAPKSPKTTFSSRTSTPTAIPPSTSALSEATGFDFGQQ
jgi:hypothetical protein